MQGTQYATKRSILCRGAFCGPTMRAFITDIDFIYWQSFEEDVLM